MVKPQKFSRFRQTDFQEKLARARRYQRKSQAEYRPSIGIRKWLAGIFLVTIVYLFGISNFFLVQQAHLRGEEGREAQVNEALRELGKHRFAYLIPKNNILFLNEKNLVQALQQYLPEVRSVKYFKREFPRYLELELEKRKPLYIWNSGPDYYLMDQDGVLFQEIHAYDAAVYAEFLITDRTGAKVIIGEQLNIGSTLGFIAALREAWAKSFSDLHPASAALPGLRSGDIFVKTSGGYDVYFDTQRDSQAQLGNLKLLLDRQIPLETHGGLAYIDLRLPNIAYYCYEDAPCAQASSLNATSTMMR